MPAANTRERICTIDGSKRVKSGKDVPFGSFIKKFHPINLSVSLSNEWIVTKRKKDRFLLLYRTKEHLAYFLRIRMVGVGDNVYVKFWVNRPPLDRNRRFSTDIRP